MQTAREKATRLAILLKEASALSMSLNVDHGIREAHTPACMLDSICRVHMGKIIKAAKAVS